MREPVTLRSYRRGWSVAGIDAIVGVEIPEQAQALVKRLGIAAGQVVSAVGSFKKGVARYQNSLGLNYQTNASRSMPRGMNYPELMRPQIQHVAVAHKIRGRRRFESEWQRQGGGGGFDHLGVTVVYVKRRSGRPHQPRVVGGVVPVSVGVYDGGDLEVAGFGAREYNLRRVVARIDDQRPRA